MADGNITRRQFCSPSLGTAQVFAVLFSMAVFVASARAQPDSCGITSVTESTKLVYPPIAKAAHIEGDVIFIVSFTQAGAINELHVLNGPEMLRLSARNFVSGWHVNPYTGPRECPIVVRFVIGKEADKPTTEITRIDTQHVRITAEMYHNFTTY